MVGFVADNCAEVRIVVLNIDLHSVEVLHIVDLVMANWLDFDRNHAVMAVRLVNETVVHLVVE